MQCNTIFCFTAMTLTSVGETDDAKGKTISEIGSMLFTRGVSGTRVVTGRDTKVIEGYTFKGKLLNGHPFISKLESTRCAGTV